MTGTIYPVTGPQTQTEKTVGELQIGDRCDRRRRQGAQGNRLSAHGRTQPLLSLDGKPDGAYLRSYRVTVQP